MATRFRALAVPVDVSTGDRRRIGEGALTHQTLPMPGRWVREDVGAHDGAITVASLTDVQTDGDQIWLTGHWFDDVDEEKMPRLAQDVAEAMHLAREGVLGFSVDLDDIEAVPVRKGSAQAATEDDLISDEDVELLITKGRMRAATLVDIPAYAETNHTIQFLESEDDEAVSEPDDEADPNPTLAVTAALSGDVNLPVGDREWTWDGAAVEKRVFGAYSDKDGKIDKSRAGRAFLWVEGDGTKRKDYKLPFADIVDGKLTIIPRAIGHKDSGHGVPYADIPEAGKKAIESRVCSLYAKVRKKYADWPECPFDRAKAAASEHSALTASRGGLLSFDAFTPPVKVERLMPITYDWERGIAYGHIAPWGLCHEGVMESCLLAPKDSTGDYREFHAHRVETDQGTVYAGRITAGGRHPETHDGITAHHVRHHHDDMVTVAYVHAREDEFGIFVCGPIVAGLDSETRQLLSRRKVSADWRETVDGLSMIEVLALGPGPTAVSEPGFPVKVAFSGGRQVALVASLMPAVTLDVRAGQTITADMVRALDMGEAFKTAYHTIKAEEAAETQHAAEAMRLRGELAAVMSADACRARDELARAIGA